jgi:hypothetical protein
MLDYEKLDVYQCAIEHLSNVFKWLALLPRGHSALADQWRRAAMSIPRRGVRARPASQLRAIPDPELVLGKQLVVRMVEMLTKMRR